MVLVNLASYFTASKKIKGEKELIFIPSKLGKKVQFYFPPVADNEPILKSERRNSMHNHLWSENQ